MPSTTAKTAARIAAKNKARNREYTKKLAVLQKSGLYDPKGTELTNYRKKRINALFREFGSDLQEKRIIAVKVPKNADKKTIRANAEASRMQVINDRIIVERAGYTRAKMEFNSKYGEYEIVLSGKKKKGKTTSRTTTAHIPLAKPDALDRERARFRKMGKSFGKLKKGETLIFRVHANGVDGMSHFAFHDIDMLIKALDRYQKDIPSRVGFYRAIQIEKTTTKNFAAERKERNAARRPKKRKVNATGRNV